MQDADKVEELSVEQFQANIKRLAPLIRRRLRKYSADKSQIDDWMQNATLYFWKKKLPVKHWLKKALWMAIDEVRTRNKSRRLIQGKRVIVKNRISTNSRADKVVWNDRRVANFYDLIRTRGMYLWPDEKDILAMHYVHGLTQNEIAGRLGVVESNISVRMTEIKKKIKEYLETTGGQHEKICCAAP